MHRVDAADFKRRAAERALAFVRSGQVVGLGTGTTAAYAITGLARRVEQEGVRIVGVPTSDASARMARDLGIPLRDLNDVDQIDVTIDGADQVDPSFSLIKGAGGAHTREKLVARASRLEIIIIDAGKLVSQLGGDVPVPVEVLPFGWRTAQRGLESLGCTATMRRTGESPFVTDNGNYVVDCRFAGIDDPAALEQRIKLLPAVVESGLFVGLTGVLVVAGPDGLQVRETGAQ